MTEHKYATPEYYATHFSDILSDVGDGNSPDANRPNVVAIIRGFQLAIESWLQYHESAVTSYKELRDGIISEDLALKAFEEEQALPKIPAFPSVLK